MSRKEFEEQIRLTQKELDNMHKENLKRPKPDKFNPKPLFTKNQRQIIKINLIFILSIIAIVLISKWFDAYRLVWQSPILFRTPVYAEKREGVAQMLPTTDNKAQVVPEPSPTATPSPTPEIKKTGKISAYSCGGLKTEAEIKMNCPSLLTGQPKTATGATPIPYKTMACDRANLGKTIMIEGLGTYICNDTGGAITGAGRFDIYVQDVDEARQFGVQELAYKVL